MVHEFCQENRIPLPESLRQEDLLEKRILLTNSVDDFLTLACQLCEEVMEVRPGAAGTRPPQSKPERISTATIWTRSCPSPRLRMQCL